MKLSGYDSCFTKVTRAEPVSWDAHEWNALQETPPPSWLDFPGNLLINVAKYITSCNLINQQNTQAYHRLDNTGPLDAHNARIPDYPFRSGKGDDIRLLCLPDKSTDRMPQSSYRRTCKTPPYFLRLCNVVLQPCSKAGRVWVRLKKGRLYIIL